MKIFKSIVICFVCLSPLFTTGCATRKPVMISPVLLEKQPVTISILPAIDARKDKKSAKIKNLDKVIQPQIKRSLKSLKYRVDVLNNYAVEQPEGYLAEMTDEELITLAPDGKEAVFLFVLDDLTNNNFIISHSARVMSRAYLIDPVKKEIIWKDKETYSTGGLGLIHAFIPYEKEVLSMSAGNMISSIPKKGSKPKKK